MWPLCGCGQDYSKSGRVCFRREEEDVARGMAKDIGVTTAVGGGKGDCR